MHGKRCVKCGYDLTGLSGLALSRVKCPECGVEQREADRFDLNRPPRLLWLPVIVGAIPSLAWILVIAADIPVRAGWSALELWLYGSIAAAAFGATLGGVVSACVMHAEDRALKLSAAPLRVVLERCFVAGVGLGLANVLGGYTLGFVVLALTHGRLIC